MVGIVVCAHGNLAHELVSTLNFITGGRGEVKAVAVDHNVAVESARELVKLAIMEADEGSGVLVVTDLFGGAPTNICMSLQDDIKMEIIAGVNLPVLLKAVSLQNTSNLEGMAAKLAPYGRENIRLVSELLKVKDAQSERDS